MDKKPSCDKVTVGKLQLPVGRAAVCERTLKQALALELGHRSVFEITACRRKGEGVEIHYRAVDSAVWETFKNKAPQHWPLVPEAIKAQRAQIIQTRLSAVLQVAAGVMLLLTIAIKAGQLNVNAQYADRLEQLTQTQGSAQRTQARPQDSWSARMNVLAQSVARVGGKITSFEWSTTGGRVEVTGVADSETLKTTLEQALGRSVVCVDAKGGVWVWRE